MYIKKSQRDYKGKKYISYLLVESIHTPKGPRQRTICSLGDLRPRPRAEWLQLAHRLKEALQGQERLFAAEAVADPELPALVARVLAHRDQSKARAGHELAGAEADDLVSIRPAGVRVEAAREAGPVHVGCQFWQKLGLDGILAAAGLSERARQLTRAMVMNRLIHPRSEHAMPDWIRSTALADIAGTDFRELTEDSLYRNMDRLYHQRAAIETALVAREQALFNLDRTVYLYDLTSTYFEGQAAGNPKAKRGYSRDHRPDCPQVVVGLVLSWDGFPLCHEVYDGNMQDRNSVKPILDRLAQRVVLQPGQTVVVDRGMAFDENLREITGRGLHYIVAARQGERDQWLEEFEGVTDFAAVQRVPSPTNPYQQKTPVLVKRRESNGEVHVLCVSAGRQAKDRAIREKKEQQLVADLARLERRVTTGRLKDPAKISEAIGRLKERYPRVARYYRMAYDDQTKRVLVEKDLAKLAQAEELDGSYLLKTNRTDLTAAEAWRIYSLLTRAEEAFRNMKSPLSERPIFHQIERRVDTHIFLCVLAFHLLVSVEQTLLARGVHTSWATVRDTLSTHQVCTVVLPTSSGAELHIRKATTAEPEHCKIYNLLGIDEKVIEPKRTWVNKS